VELPAIPPRFHTMGTDQAKMQTYWLAQRQIEKLKAQLNSESDVCRHQQLEAQLGEEERKLATLA
jgi:hypothetical protein